MSYPIKEKRRALGWRQADMAAYLKTTQTTVSHWETGKHPVPTAAQLAIDAALAEEVKGEDATLEARYLNVLEQERAKHKRLQDAHKRLEERLWQTSDRADKLQEKRKEAERNAASYKRLYEEAQASVERLQRTNRRAGQGNADTAHLKRSLNKLIGKCHPDKFASARAYEEEMSEVTRLLNELKASL